MLKVLGGLLILAGGGIICTRRIRASRHELTAVREWIAALEKMVGEIRWKNTPLPDIACGMKGMGTPGPVMAAVAEPGNRPLQEVWQTSTARVQPPEVGEILCRLALSGDSESLLGELQYASEQLKHLLQEKQRCQKEGEKLCLTLSFSAAGLLIVLLI